MQQHENQQLELEERVHTAAAMKSRNTEERAKEVANINKQREAGRARRRHAVLRIFLRRSCRNETFAHARTMQCNSGDTQNKYMQ